MDMRIAVRALVANEGKNGTVESMAVAYAIALGVINGQDWAQWSAINATLPNDKLLRIKEKAWRKYEAMIAMPNI